MCVTEPLPLNELAIRHNAAMLEYCRTSISALAGSTAGILGLTGLYGFAFYFLTAFMMSVRTIHLCTVCALFVFILIIKEHTAVSVYYWVLEQFHIVFVSVNVG